MRFQFYEPISLNMLVIAHRTWIECARQPFNPFRYLFLFSFFFFGFYFIYSLVLSFICLFVCSVLMSDQFYYVVFSIEYGIGCKIRDRVPVRVSSRRLPIQKAQ